MERTKKNWSLGRRGMAFFSILFGGSMISIFAYTVVNTLSSASTFRNQQSQKVIAEGYVTELAEYLRAKSLIEMEGDAMGNLPIGVPINDGNHIVRSLCPVPASGGPVDPPTSLATGTLGRSTVAQRSYIARVLDLRTMTTSVPCGKTLRAALTDPTTQRFLFDIQVAWKDETGRWQNETVSVLGGESTPIVVNTAHGEVEIDTLVPIFYMGAEDRSADPDPYPYKDFQMCFRGLFGRSGSDLISLQNQRVSFDLKKGSGCGSYSLEVIATAPDGTVTRSTNRMNHNGTDSFTLDLTSGDVIEATLRITGSGGGCDTGAQREMLPPGSRFTSFVPGGYPGRCE